MQQNTVICNRTLLSDESEFKDPEVRVKLPVEKHYKFMKRKILNANNVTSPGASLGFQPNQGKNTKF